MVDQRAIIRFLKYTATGVSTLLLDLGLLYLFTDYFGWHYLLSAASAFLVSTSANHWLARRYAFPETRYSDLRTYAGFLAIALVGIGWVTGLMYILVEWLGANYVLARFLVSGVTGMWNYLINLYFNFRVAGVYQLRP